MIPGYRISSGEGIGYPLQNCWASLVAQLVKNLPTMQETWVRSLSHEDSLEKGMTGYPLQYSCLENPMDRGAWQATVHGVARVGHDLATKTTKTSNKMRIASFFFFMVNSFFK